MSIKTDRSRILSYQSCPRKRYHEYHYQGKGIRANYINIPLTVGSNIHMGLETLLLGNNIRTTEGEVYSYPPEICVETAVKRALKAYDKECHERSFQQEDLDTSFTYQENRALIEALIRVYAKVQLPRLLERFEVLEVEKEIEVELVPSEHCTLCKTMGVVTSTTCVNCNKGLILMSRPDAILRERSTDSIYVLSFKTSSAWMGDLSEQQNKWDVQGISEMVAVESWLDYEWHKNARSQGWDGTLLKVTASGKVEHHATATRVAGIKMEYLIKGKYSKAESSQPLMNISKGQRYYSNVLIHPYANIKQWGMGSELVDLRFLYKWQDELGANRQLDYRTWKPCNIWELGEGAIKEWIEFMASSEEGMRVLERMVVTPMEYYRNEEDVQEWLTSTIHQETEIAASLRLIEKAEKIKDLANQYGNTTADNIPAKELAQYFPKYRHSCFSYNSVCQFAGICWENQEPAQLLASGEMKFREANHKGELE